MSSEAGVAGPPPEQTIVPPEQAAPPQEQAGTPPPDVLMSIPEPLPGPIGVLPGQPYNLPPAPIGVATPASTNQLFQSNTYTPAPERMPAFGSGMAGFDFLLRLRMALLSGVETEVRWAVRALLEVSNRNPDIFRERAIASVNTNTPGNTPANTVHQQPSASGFNLSMGALGDSHPTTIVLEALQALIIECWKEAVTSNGLNDGETAENVDKRSLLAEALVALRNLALDAETAQLLARSPYMGDIIAKGLSLPANSFALRELRLNCLEIAENVIIYLRVSPESRLFAEVVAMLVGPNASDDRATIISALRCISRICVSADRGALFELPRDVITRVLRFLLVEDEILIAASLDLLYQYALRADSVADFGESVNVEEILSTVLVRLLTYKMSKEPVDFVRLPRRARKLVPVEPPVLPENVLVELLAMPEPVRATNWIRSSYEPDSTGEVTQISLWKAYESRFEPYVSRGGRRLLPAVDFIKNVTTAFNNVAAMVVNLPNGQKKFVIKGLKPRERAILPSRFVQPVQKEIVQPKRRGPPPFAPSAALLLQAISRLEGGDKLLRPQMAALADAALLNPAVMTYLGGILVGLDGLAA